MAHTRKKWKKAFLRESFGNIIIEDKDGRMIAEGEGTNTKWAEAMQLKDIANQMGYRVYDETGLLSNNY